MLSISYGTTEADPSIPVAYQRRQCNEIMKLGLQGTTTVVASGDSGVGANCFGDYSNYPDCVFGPIFPAACPYALTIGATTLPAGKNVLKDQETATTYFASGGGFSNIFPSPSYQSTSVKNFFSNHNPPYPYYETVYNETTGANSGLYNRIGRGYPDISANGWEYLVYVDGFAQGIGGTSQSAPLVASLITLINEARLTAGKTPVGFVNPILVRYSVNLCSDNH